MKPPPSHPILTCAQAAVWEKRLLHGDESAEWAAMSRAGAGLAAAVLEDLAEAGGFPADGHILVLVGKGHNGGDALLAAHQLLHRHPEATAEVVFALGERSLRPLAQRAWRELSDLGTDRVQVRRAEGRPAYALSLDGVFGFQFRPPLPAAAAGVLRWANGLSIRLRAAVDLPSGLDEKDAFSADFTYATGILKAPLLDCAHAGRLRYGDLGFFDSGDSESPHPPASADRVLLPAVLGPLAGLRPAASDKRAFGHLLVVGGSHSFPGAVLMTVLAALRGGVGMLTAFVPESLVPSYAARAPEAMWVGWPVAPGGGLALEGEHLLRKRLERGTALVMGPGMGRDPETMALAESIVSSISIPAVIDADCLQPRIVKAARSPLILTPHAGEFARIAGRKDLRAYAAETGAAIVKKGPITAMAMREGKSRSNARQIPVYHDLSGGPVLARGGSGDILAGLIGSQLAQMPEDLLLAACRGVAWHGRAADLLARTHGQTAVTTTQILDFMPAALRG